MEQHRNSWIKERIDWLNEEFRKTNQPDEEFNDFCDDKYKNDGLQEFEQSDATKPEKSLLEKQRIAKKSATWREQRHEDQKKIAELSLEKQKVYLGLLQKYVSKFGHIEELDTFLQKRTFSDLVKEDNLLI